MSASTPQSRPRITLIAGVARNGAIGKDNALLWHLPEDLQYFRRQTQGRPVLMGRRTWESLPERFRPLPGRRNLVLSRDSGYAAPGAEVVTGLDAALDAVGDGELFVIGGAQLYAATLPMADTLLLTEVDREYDADTFFPAWTRAHWQEVSRETGRSAGAGDPLDYAWVRYERQS